MLNVSNDFIYRVTKAMQEFERDEYDWVEFYDKGRETHLKAMEYYKDQRSEIEENLVMKWNELLNKLNE